MRIDLEGFDQLQARLDKAGPELLRRSAEELEASTFDFQNTVRSKTPVDTGHLRNAWQQRKNTDHDREVFNNVDYGPRQNYGFHASEKVSAHERTISQAFGRKIRPTVVHVGEHFRTVNQPGEFFLENSVDEVQPRFVEGQRRALEGSLG